MRNSRKLMAMMLLAAPTLVGFYSCSTLDDGVYTDPITLYEKIGGNWVINSVTQVDETNQTSRPLTDQFNFSTFGINLAVDGNNEPTSYTVSGNAPAFFPKSGNWKLGNAFYNSDGSSAEIILDGNTHLTVTTVPAVQRTLEFKFTRSTKGQPFVSYVYNLVDPNAE